MSDKDMQKYGLYSLIVGVFMFIYLAALIYLIYIVIYSFYYHFQNDTLTTMQVFKMFLKKYIIAFVFYAFGSTVLKNSYKTWKSLNEKRQKANADQTKQAVDTDLVEVPSATPTNVTFIPERLKFKDITEDMRNTHIIKDLAEVPSGPHVNAPFSSEELKDLSVMCNTHIEKDWIDR